MEFTQATSPISETINAPAPAPIARQSNILIANGISMPESKSSVGSDTLRIDTYLESSKQQSNSAESWSKLNKTARLRLLLDFAETYRTEHELNDIEYEGLIDFLKDCLDKKKLHRIKDVSYSNLTGTVKAVNGLVYNRSSNRFTLRNLDKQHVSTLKSLGPKRKSSSRKETTKSRERRDCTI